MCAYSHVRIYACWHHYHWRRRLVIVVLLMPSEELLASLPSMQSLSLSLWLVVVVVLVQYPHYKICHNTPNHFNICAYSHVRISACLHHLSLESGGYCCVFDSKESLASLPSMQLISLVSLSFIIFWACCHCRCRRHRLRQQHG